MSPQSPLVPLYFEALKSLSVALGQMNIYRVGHPSVTKAVKDAQSALESILGKVNRGELVLAIDEGKLIANGEFIGTLSQVPNSIALLFNRFRLVSITFKKGITEADITTLGELASAKAEESKTMDAAGFIAKHGAVHIGFNEVVYEAVKEDEAGGGRKGPALSETLKDASVEDSIRTLISLAVPDPTEQARIFEVVMQAVRSDLEDKVREATDPIKRAKLKLENEQVRTQNVLSNVAEGVVIIDDHGRVLMMNPVAEEIYGVKLKDIAGKHLTDFIKEEHMVALASEISTPDDRALKGEIDVKAKKDIMRTLRGSTAVVQNEAGRTVGMVSSLSDVAKHKELDRMEREFVAHVTHELRAPLSSIRASLEILQGEFTGKLDDDQSRMLLTALKNADRLDDLIRNILDFSKIESGQMLAYPKPVEVAKMAQEAVDSMQPWCVKKGLQLILTLEKGLPRVSADPGRIVQVLVNLLSNAIKFSPKGGKIVVKVARGAGQSDSNVQFSVQDSGPGIPKQEQKRIFEKFVQIAAGEKNVGGTGLGLAIAKALIQMHKGLLWVESDVDKGATFHFTLPIVMDSSKSEVSSSVVKKVSWWKRLLGQG